MRSQTAFYFFGFSFALYFLANTKKQSYENYPPNFSLKQKIQEC